MMTEEQLAFYDADQFWKYWDNWGLIDFGYSKLDYEIDLKIGSDDLNYQLNFLYRLEALIGVDYNDHLKHCTAKSLPEKCPENVFYIKAVRLIKKKIMAINPNYDRQDLNTELVNKTLLTFKDFPEAAKPFNIALQTFKEGGDDRQIVDGMRVALEIFLKKKLKNEKSLENQIPVLGTYLKEKGTSPEIMNMFVKVLEGYTKYQNEYVKHNDRINRDEVELLINLTLTFISFIINK